METKISLVIQSMLNDAMIEVNHPMLIEEAQERLRFVKYLIHYYPNTNKKINVDVVYNQWRINLT